MSKGLEEVPKAGAVSEVRGDIGIEAALPSERSEPEIEAEEEDDDDGDGPQAEAAFEEVAL